MISVVTAYYNDQYYLDECVDSVKRSAQHVSFPIEHIVCDDASRLNTSGYKYDKDIKVLRHEENKGPAAARNTAIRATQYPWILNLDCDDMIDEEYFSCCGAYLDSYDVIYTDTHWFGEAEQDFKQWDLYHPLRFANHPLPSCLLFKRELWERIGGYNERKDLIGFEDWAFSLAIAKEGCKYKHINEYLYLYRRRKNTSLYEKVFPYKQQCVEVLQELYA